MDNNIYEVTRDEYAGFIRQLAPGATELETYHEEDQTILKVMSHKTGKHLATRIVPEEGEPHFFVFNMPNDDERVAAKPVMKVELESKEEVQNFFNALGKLQKEKESGRTV